MKKVLVIFLIFSGAILNAQDSLLDALEEETQDMSYKVEAIFKGTRLINGHSIETRKKGNLDFLISHRFGTVNSGAYNLFGLDQSNVRIGFDYGITDNINAGFGRNSFQKTFDGYLKYRLVGQKTKGGSPVAVTALASMAIKTLKDPVFEDVIDFSNRLTYAYQVLLARKISPKLSLQLMPTMVHFNALQPEQKTHDIFAGGVGGRVKLTQRLSLNMEYYHQFNTLVTGMQNSLAVGFDIETGGHVFQLHLTNSRAMIEKGFITETTDDFFNGDIRFGFNIARTFQLGNSKE